VGTVAGLRCLYSSPLFTHLFPHAWLDLRGIRDVFMREKRSDYATTARSIAQREYRAQSPQAQGYHRDLWGSAPAMDRTSRVAGVRDRPSSLWLHGAGCPSDPTMAPWSWAMLALFAPGCAHGTRQLLARFRVCRNNASSAASISIETERGGWLSEGWYGLDQGLSGHGDRERQERTIWSLLRECPHVRRGLKRAGFTGGWLT
jgi:hypothetical protein